MHAVGREMTHSKIKAVYDTKLFRIQLEIHSPILGLSLADR